MTDLQRPDAARSQRSDARASTSDDRTLEEARQKLVDLIEDVRFTMFATNQGGRMRARPMTTLRSDPDGRLWFFTPRDSALVDEVRTDPRVCLAYGDNGSATYVSVSGRAAPSDDAAMTKELWNPALKAWFEGSDDPNLQLLEITVEDAEYWDGPRNRFVRLAGILAAAVTHKEYDAGEQGELSLDPPAQR